MANEIITPEEGINGIAAALNAALEREAMLAEGRRLVLAARRATGPAVEHARSAAETWFWQNTHRLFGSEPHQPWTV
jgi:hypothetical protein